MTEQTSTAPAQAEEPKQSIPQKVEGLQAEKTRLTTEMNSMPEGEQKTGAQERIAVIDRKLRWYAGRSGESKPKATARPSRAKAPRQPKAAAQTAAPVPVAATANES